MDAQTKRQNATIEMINTLGLTVEEVTDLTGLSKATIKKLMKGGNVAGRTVRTVFGAVEHINEEVRIETMKKYNMEF